MLFLQHCAYFSTSRARVLMFLKKVRCLFALPIVNSNCSYLVRNSFSFYADSTACFGNFSCAAEDIRLKRKLKELEDERKELRVREDESKQLDRKKEEIKEDMKERRSTKEDFLEEARNEKEKRKYATNQNVEEEHEGNIRNWLIKRHKETALLRRVHRLNHTAVAFAIQEAYSFKLDDIFLWEAFSDRCVTIASSFTIKEIAVILNAFSRRGIRDLYLFEVLINMVWNKLLCGSEECEDERSEECEDERLEECEDERLEECENEGSEESEQERRGERKEKSKSLSEKNQRQEKAVSCDAVSLAAIAGAFCRLNIKDEMFIELLEKQLVEEKDKQKRSKKRKSEKLKLNAYGLSIIAKACGKMNAKRSEKLIKYILNELKKYENSLQPQEITNFFQFFWRLNIVNKERLIALNKRICFLIDNFSSIKNNTLFDAYQCAVIFIAYAHLNIPSLLLTEKKENSKLLEEKKTNYDSQESSTEHQGSNHFKNQATQFSSSYLKEDFIFQNSENKLNKQDTLIQSHQNFLSSPNSEEPYFVINEIIRRIPNFCSHINCKTILKFILGFAKLQKSNPQTINLLSKALVERTKEEKLELSDAVIIVESYADLKVRREWLLRKVEEVLAHDFHLLTFADVKTVLKSFKKLSLKPYKLAEALRIQIENKRYNPNEIESLEKLLD